VFLFIMSEIATLLLLLRDGNPRPAYLRRTIGRAGVQPIVVAEHRRSNPRTYWQK